LEYLPVTMADFRLNDCKRAVEHIEAIILGPTNIADQFSKLVQIVMAGPAVQLLFSQGFELHHLVKINAIKPGSETSIRAPFKGMQALEHLQKHILADIPGILGPYAGFDVPFVNKRAVKIYERLPGLRAFLEVQAVQHSYGSRQHFSSLYPSTHNNLSQGFFGSWILK